MTVSERELKKVMAHLGAKGGAANSSKQKAARTKNAAKARQAKLDAKTNGKRKK